MIANKCVAAATSCNVSIQTNFSDISTKDSDNDWAENFPTGHSWSGSVDALVTNGRYDEATVKTDTELPGSGGEVFKSTKDFIVQPGCTIYAEGDAEVGFSENDDPVTTLHGGVVDYTNTGSEAQTLNVNSDTENVSINVYMLDPARMDCAAVVQAAKAGTPVTVKFSVTGGRNNVVEEQTLVQGTAIMSDLTLTAANRDVSKYTVQLTGTGELELVEE